MFLNKKHLDITIKGKRVTGGNKRQFYIPKEDASSPTVATKAVLITCIINVEENIDVAIIDIPNAFIQKQVENEKNKSFIKIRGILVDILYEIDPHYKIYVTRDKKGGGQLLVRCKNALYGTMVESLLFYSKFIKSLKEIGFKQNPYDPCVFNTITMGSQMAIYFYKDDCKQSHRKKKTNDLIIK